jgi:predicted aspartyl protease
MGEVTVAIKVQNWLDIKKIALGERTVPPRTVQTQALVDTGAVRFYLKASLIEQLGLRPIREVLSRTMANLSVRRRVFSNVELELQGRSASFEVVEVPDELPNVIGQTPLEILDWVVDARGRQLIPNPAHPHGEMCDDF